MKKGLLNVLIMDWLNERLLTIVTFSILVKSVEYIHEQYHTKSSSHRCRYHDPG